MFFFNLKKFYTKTENYERKKINQKSILKNP